MSKRGALPRSKLGQIVRSAASRTGSPCATSSSSLISVDAATFSGTSRAAQILLPAEPTLNCDVPYVPDNPHWRFER